MWISLSNDIQTKLANFDGDISVATNNPLDYSLQTTTLRASCIATKDNKVLFVKSAKQGRHWELPGGTIETGESPEAAAKREFTEETGLTADAVSPTVILLWAFPERIIIEFVFDIQTTDIDFSPDTEIEDISWKNEIPTNTTFGITGKKGIRHAIEKSNNTTVISQ